MSKIDKSLEEYRNWCSSLGILCADDINRAIAQGEINNIINLSEIWPVSYTHLFKLGEKLCAVNTSSEYSLILLAFDKRSFFLTSIAFKLLSFADEKSIPKRNTAAIT